MQRILLCHRRALVALLLVVFGLFFSSVPSFADGQKGNEIAPEAAPGELLVGIRESAMPLARMAPLAPSLGEVVSVHEKLRFVRFKLRPGVKEAQAAATLARLPNVSYAEPNYIVRICGTPDDLDYATKQYGPQITQANLAWDIWTPQQQTIIAIIDTGVDYNHPDLSRKILRDAWGGVIGYNPYDPTQPPMDVHGHGTHCAGIAAADTNNSVGIAGIAGWNPLNAAAQDFIKIMPIKGLTDGGWGTWDALADGIVWATDHGASVISMSLGGGGSATAENAVRYAISKNVVVVAAAGNNGSSSLFYPAAFEGVISVGATDAQDTLTWFSNYGVWVKIAAPGNAIYSTFPQAKDGYATLSGTSMACPHVAGAAAVIRAQYPELSVKDVTTALIRNVDSYNPYKDDFVDGGKREIASLGGRLNVFKALKNAKPTVVISTFTLSPVVVSGATAITGYLRLNRPALKGGSIISLSYSATDGLLVPPTQVVIPEGLDRATFALSSLPVATDTAITVTATTGAVSRSATLNIVGPKLNSVNINPTTLTGGAKAEGRVTLSSPAPESGLAVNLSCDNPNVTIPTSVQVPPFATTVTFVVETKSVVQRAVAALTATYGLTAKTARFTLLPPDITQFTLSSRLVTGGAPVTGKITLNSPAAANGVIQLTNTNPAARVPATVTIPAGQNNVTFTFNTVSPGANRAFGSVKATFGSTSVSLSLTVVP